MPTVACEATNMNKHSNLAKFDTDSGLVGIDNRCSACISGYIQDFKGHLQYLQTKPSRDLGDP